MILISWLACVPSPPHIPATPDSEAETGVDSPVDTGPWGPGSWSDPIAHLGQMDVDVDGMELTDATWHGDQLILAGQHQRGMGAVWVMDVSDPLAPVQVGQNTIHHVQYVCSTGDTLWGSDRQGGLLRFDDPTDYPVVSLVGAEGDVACSSDQVAVGLYAGGALVVDAASGEEVHRVEGTWSGVALQDDVLFTAGPEGVARWVAGEKTHDVALTGWCRDIETGPSLAVSCGSQGVVLLDPADLSIQGSWSGHASARVAAWDGTGIWVAAWSELLYLDATDPEQIQLVGSESSPSSAMAVVSGSDGLAWVADWNRPFTAQVEDVASPEVRLAPEHGLPGDIIQVINDGREPLWVSAPDGIEQDMRRVLPGERARLTLPQDQPLGMIEVETDDPDEPLVTIEVGSQNGQTLGEAAPPIEEMTLDGELWTLEAHRGEVVWLATFESG